MAEYLADQVQHPGNSRPDRLVRSTDPKLALLAAFPGIWIREDGAFRDEGLGISWEPGDVEAEVPFHHPGMVRGGSGLCVFHGSMGSSPPLKLSQLWALTDYIEAVDAACSDKTD